MKKKLTTQGFEKLKQEAASPTPATGSPAGMPLFLRGNAETPQTEESSAALIQSKVDDAIDSVLQRLAVPDAQREIVKSGAGSAAAEGTLAPLETAMDQAQLKDADKQAVRAAFQSAVDIALP